MSQDTGIQQPAETPSDADGPHQPNPTYVRILLITVIGLGILMVVGAAVVIGTVIKRVNNPEAVPQKPGFGETVIAIPQASQLVDVENGETRIIVKLKTKDGPLFDIIGPAQGHREGSHSTEKPIGAFYD